MGVDLPEPGQEGSGQPVLAAGAGGVQNPPGDGGQFRRERLSGRVEVNSHAQHGVVHAAALHADGGLAENAADFLPLQKNVVDPLDLRGHTADFLDGLAQGDRSYGGQGGNLEQGVLVRAQQNTQINAGIPGGVKAAAVASPSGALAVGDNCGALRGALLCPLPDPGVGGGNLIQHGKPICRKRQIPAQSLGGENVTGRSQPISTIGDGVDGKALLTEDLHGFPDGGPGHAQPSGNFLSGKIGTGIFFQQGEKLLTGGHKTFLSPPARRRVQRIRMAAESRLRMISARAIFTRSGTT